MKKLILIAIILIFVVLTTSVLAEEVAPDQVNDVDTSIWYGCGTIPNGNLAQSFTPSASPLAEVELRLRAGGEFPEEGYNTTINIKSGTYDGPTLGTATTFVPGPQTSGTQLMVNFKLTEIEMTPGETYIIELISPGQAILTWAGARNDTYDGGIAFGCLGTPISNEDFIFTTYTTVNTPIGDNILVQPTDTTVALIFNQVNEAGTTNLIISDYGEYPPLGFIEGEPSIYYDIGSTADFSSSIIEIETNSIIDVPGFSIIDINTNSIIEIESNSILEIDSGRIIDIETNSIIDMDGTASEIESVVGSIIDEVTGNLNDMVIDAESAIDDLLNDSGVTNASFCSIQVSGMEIIDINTNSTIYINTNSIIEIDSGRIIDIDTNSITDISGTYGRIDIPVFSIIEIETNSIIEIETNSIIDVPGSTITTPGLVEMYIDYSEISFNNEEELMLFHYENDEWVDVTSLVDTRNDIIYGVTDSLSVFAIFEPYIEVSPLVYDFGEVEVGSSSTAMFTIMNLGWQELTISDNYIEGSADFSITMVPENLTISPSESKDIEVTFTPSLEGYVAAILQISWNNSELGEESVNLGGMGVSQEFPPLETIANILDFIDSSIADGSLVGSGPGNSANGRLNALRNMIEAAGDLIENEDIGDACQQLLDAYKKTDGISRPPDFVAGPAVSTLASMIQNLRVSLGCE